MRIISGKHRGRKIETVKSKSVRPTKGMTREALFNILSHGKFNSGDRRLLDGCTVLDLFCGSGALGIEALSRGASQVVFIDKSSECLDMVKHNIEHINETANATYIRCDSANPPPAKLQCDLVFIDPPYESGLANSSLKNLIKSGWLKDNSIIIVELAKKENLQIPDGYEKLDERRYGITQIVILEWRG